MDRSDELDAAESAAWLRSRRPLCSLTRPPVDLRHLERHSERVQQRAMRQDTLHSIGWLLLPKKSTWVGFFYSPVLAFWPFNRLNRAGFMVLLLH